MPSIGLAGAFSIGVAAQNFDNVEIRAQEIRPGVAVMFGAGGNMGLSYGTDGSILIDDQFAPLSDKIMVAIEDLGAPKVRFLVNSHWHGDHSGGNENFGNAGATIFAQDNVRHRLATVTEFRGQPREVSPHKALPIVTFDHGLTFNANGDTIEVRHFGGGHTDGDSVVYWRNANVIHTGDMFNNNGGYPFVDLESGGNAQHLVTSLDQVIGMIDNDTVVIPGHGELGGRDNVIAWRNMTASAVERVQALKAAGKSLEEAQAAKPLVGLGPSDDGGDRDNGFVASIWQSLEAHGK